MANEELRSSGNGQNISILELGELPVNPLFRLEIVSDPVFIEHFEEANRGEFSPQEARSIQIDESRITKPSRMFTCKVGALITNERVHGRHAEPPRYVLYQHIFGRGSEYPSEGLFYIGITQRDWKRRWGEHKAAINRGSPLKFHRSFRERMEAGQITFINHFVMEAVGDLGLLNRMEEQIVDGHWDDDRLLNMIPGGEKGLKYLHEHGIVDRKVEPMPDQRDAILETWMRENPRKGLPAPWVAEKWKDDEWAANIICGPKVRLSIAQVRAIRQMHSEGLTPEEIREKVMARNLSQVIRVIAGKTYERIH